VLELLDDASDDEMDLGIDEPMCDHSPGKRLAQTEAHLRSNFHSDSY